MKQGWEIKKLGEVCTIERGGSPRPIKSFITSDPQGLNWIKIGDTDPTGKYIYSTKEKIKVEGLKKSRWVDENDFLLSNSMSFGRPYILKTNGCIHDGWLVLRNYHKWLNIDFFYYLLLSPNVQNQFKAKAQGSTVSNLNTQRVAETEILIPSLLEQGRIVGVLDAAFAKIDALKENAQKNLGNAKTLFQQVLKQELTPKPNWQTKKLSDISKNLDTIRKPVTKKDRVRGEYPYYGASGIVDYVDGYLFDEDLLLISEDGANLLARSTPIAFSISGKTWVNNHAHVLKFNNSITQKYVELYIESIPIDGFVTGMAQPKLTQKSLYKIPIPIPETISEQQQIVSKIKGFKIKSLKVIANAEKTIAECDALKQAVLRRAFNGEL